MSDQELDGVALDEIVASSNYGAVTADDLFGGLPISHSHPHGSNILKKARDAARSRSKEALIRQVADKYRAWRSQAEGAVCELDNPENFVLLQAELYQDYRDFLDDPIVDAFDARGALQPSALEEFCYFLLRPTFSDFEGDLAVGHREVFQSLYFTSPSFESFVELPAAQYPVGNLDFVIGVRIRSRFETSTHSSVQDLFLPAVAIECKTYLDRPRWRESDILADRIKRGFPGCLYIVLAEFLKLDLSKVNVHGSLIDKVYVLRRSRNVDRARRRADSTGLPAIHAPALLDLFVRVRDHLTAGWTAPDDWENTGILK